MTIHSHNTTLLCNFDSICPTPRLPQIAEMKAKYLASFHDAIKVVLAERNNMVVVHDAGHRIHFGFAGSEGF